VSRPSFDVELDRSIDKLLVVHCVFSPPTDIPLSLDDTLHDTYCELSTVYVVCNLLNSLLIDNRIYNSRLNSPHQLRRRKCPQFSWAIKWRTLRKTGCYWAEEYTTSQLHRCACAEVNKFLLAYVILFKHVYFRQYFAFLRERIFNCCRLHTVKLKLKFEIE